MLKTPPLQQEVAQAISRTLAHGLMAEPPNFGAKPRLASEQLRSEIAATCLSFARGKSTGLCLMIAQACVDYITDRLECEAWVAVGWLSDLGKDGSFFWMMDPDELCQGLAAGNVGFGEFHAWVVLDSGEIIDPVVFPTLAENFRQFSRGSGRCLFALPNGRPYKVTPGLPLLQYHPQAFFA